MTGNDGETDTATGTVVVEQAATATPEPDTATPEPDVESPTEGPVEEPGGFDILPVAFVALALLLGAGYIAYRQREQ